MKYDNTFLKDLMQEGKAIVKEQEDLDARKKALAQQKKNYIAAYFKNYGIEDCRTLPTSHNTFISYPEFFIRQNEEGKIFWIARGKRKSIKDGEVTYGHTEDELWQGQWEALPENIKKLTIEQATENSKPTFSMSPTVFRGTDFSAPAYILHESDDGFQLVWRKAGTAYINRMSGSSASSSGLQILYAKKHENFRKGSEEETKAWTKINDACKQATGRGTLYSNVHFTLTEGGRLSVGLLEKEEKKIDLIFGNGVTQEIIEKLKLQQANRTKQKKVLKNGSDKSSKDVFENDPLKHPNVKPGKLKL